MTRLLFVVLVNLIWVFASNAKAYINNSAILTSYDQQDNYCGQFESSQASILSFGIIEGKNIPASPLALDNKRINCYKCVARYLKNNFTTSNINLLSFIRKDIHFLSVLLI